MFDPDDRAAVAADIDLGAQIVSALTGAPTQQQDWDPDLVAEITTAVVIGAVTNVRTHAEQAI